MTLTAAQKHTPAPWKHKDANGKYLASQTKWSADYDGKAPVASWLPILSGKQTVALCVNIDREWGDKTAQENAAFIVRACNSHYELLEALQAANEYLIKTVSAESIPKLSIKISAAIAKATGAA